MTTITVQPTTSADLEALTAAAAAAAPVWRASTAAERASWLRAAADALDASADELVEIADRETRLGTTRLGGEVGRTTAQLRLFAAVVEEGSYLELTVDDADASATPPRPALRRLLVPVGPVAVFSASNFPFAFSVAGGDTASALAAGCPVIVKAHSGHPELSRRTAEVVAAALESAGAPAGSLALIEGRDAGNALVQHPVIQAAGFTGSLGGGRALFDLATGRPDPIPFYGELGSVNPVVLTPAAVSARGDELAKGLVGSFTLGVGQFCTKPGVVFIPRGAGFEAAVAEHAGGAVGGPLLTDRITAAFPEGIERLVGDASVEIVAGKASVAGARVSKPGVWGVAPSRADAAEPVVLATDASAVADRPDVLLEECFGPVTLLVRYDGPDDLKRALEAVPGSLTATLHSESGDDVADVLSILQLKAGRVLFAGWPTGVAVTWSQQHGGPWPATTSLHTSVGATAIRRFLRPLVFQDAPEALLPEVLRDESLTRLPHRRNGVLRTP
jgi:NADP-dependent aldehyde dehydrogenase